MPLGNTVTACIHIHLIFVVYFALPIGAVTPFRVAFDIKFTKPCNTTSSVFANVYGVTMRECVADCESRTKCFAVNYYRRRHVCELLLDDDSGVPATGDRMPGCVHVTKEDIANVRRYNCSENEACITDIEGNQCVVKECGILNVQNGIVRGNINSIGAVRKYHCNHGYVAEGRTDNIKCLETGAWDLEPTCLYDCGDPASVNHASVSAGQTTAGSQRTYQCDPTYVLADDRAATSLTVTCLNTSKSWSRTDVSCIIDCGEPPQGGHVTLLPGNMTVGSDRTYKCNTGYSLSSGIGHMEFTITCTGDGSWSEGNAECVPDCGEPLLGTKASLSPGNTIVGTQRTYTCNYGYVLNTDLESTYITTNCTDDGVWSVDHVTCVKVRLVGDACAVDTDCSNTNTQCIQGRCFCHVYFQWNADAKECTQRCSSVTDEFETITRTYISGYNDVTQYGYPPSLTTCMAICIANPVCYHIEMLYDRCNLGNVTIEMVRDAAPDDIVYSYFHDVHSRICN